MKKMNRLIRKKEIFPWIHLSRSRNLLLLILAVAIVAAMAVVNVSFSLGPDPLHTTALGPEGFLMRNVGSRQFSEVRKKPLAVFLSPSNTTASIQRDATNQNMDTSNSALLVSFDKNENSFRITFEQQFFLEASENGMIPVKLSSSAIDSDFNELEFESLKDETHFERRISSNDAIHYEQYKNSLLMSDSKTPVDEFYYNDPAQDVPRDCRRQSWVSLRFPTCNPLHEVTFDRPRGKLQEFEFKLVGEGTFRQTYVFKRKSEGIDPFVMKTLIFKRGFDAFVRRQLYIVPMEGLIMERLTASPYITDIYGFCGATSMLELMPQEVNELIQLGSGRANQTVLDQLDNVYPKNELFPVEKARIALEMAESLAALHGFRDGVILHGDNHIDQFLANSENLIKLGDFNLATIPEWNDEKGEYCKRERVPWAFQFRAPEEIGGIPFDDKMDVFTLGNSIYSLITGLRPFYDNRKAKEICAKILNRERGFVDPRYRKRNWAETKLLEIMDRVWEHDSEKRPDIFTVVKSLRGIVSNATDK